jgi:hypothetical protein
MIFGHNELSGADYKEIHERLVQFFGESGVKVENALEALSYFIGCVLSKNSKPEEIESGLAFLTASMRSAAKVKEVMH